MKNFLSNYGWSVIGISVIIFAIFLAPAARESDQQNPMRESEEIIAIKVAQNLSEQTGHYKKLIERVGAAQAQEELYRSGLPFDGQTHLLNHVVGDVLYEKYGAEGLPQCRDYFLSSCYHGFILHAIAAGGMAEVGKSFEECKKSGPTISTQCAHAIGHGFLANAGYKNLTQALKTCDEAAATMLNFPSFNCYDGVFMENIWAIHDGEPSPDRWVKESDHFYPCNDPRIDEKYLLGCWSNQPALAYQQFKGDVRKVAHEVCSGVEDANLKDMCFNGLARQIHPLTRGSAESTFNLCGLMPTEKWQSYCVAINASSSYSVGDRILPFVICKDTQESGKTECYDRLLNSIRAYRRPNESFKDLCAKIEDKEWRSNCEQF